MDSLLATGNADMVPRNITTAASFSPTSLQSPNAWVGHIPFAAWVIREVSPSIFVELGTHSGNSYFAFCQSVAEAGLSSRCFAVDTWQGDEHAGQYNDVVFAKVSAHHQEHYAGFSRLLRMTFDEAVTCFADESIGLLHIDGLHTYEAVRHDFETWLPKLAPGAVVMFHDTNVRERNFGVWKFWEELQTRYSNNLEFVHSHGLGVLQLNNAPDDKRLGWLQPESPEKQQLTDFFAALGSNQLERFELHELKQHAAVLLRDVADRDGQIAAIRQTVTERDGQVAGLDQTMASLKQGVIERDRQIANLSQTVTERDSQIASLAHAIARRDGQVANQTQAITERDRQVARLNQAVAERSTQVAELARSVANLNREVTERDKQIANLTESVTELDGQLAGLRQTVAERDGKIADLSHALEVSDVQISDLAQAVHDKEVHIGNLDQALRVGKERVGNLMHDISEIRASTSWRLTRPVRFVGHQLLRIRIVLKALPYALSMCGGYSELIKHVWSTYRDEGIDGIKLRILFSASPGAPPPVIDHEQPVHASASAQPDHNDYDEWVRRYDTLTDHDRERIRIRIDNLQRRPFISVVMPVYNPPLNMLEDAIRSVQCQLYPDWELCIADDASTDACVRKLLQRYVESDSRIKVVFREENGHISAASNSALELSKGEYVALLDNDDLLREHALFWVADAIVANPDAGLIYSDEDKVDQSGRRYDPYFKPDWNPDLFRSHNLICHLGVYRTDLVRKLGGFREGYEGAQDYDLALRCTEQLAPPQIVHIPRVLYHWRSHPGSTAQAGSEKNYALLAGARALNAHFSRTDVSAKAELLDFGMYRVRYAIPSVAPLVSLIIPTRNGLNLIRQCIESILAKTTYRNYEILVVDNGSDDPDALAYFASLAGDARIRVLRDESPFNYSALNNAAAREARGEYLGLVNNDIEVISPEWLDELMGLAIQPGVGAVGARLWYPNDSLQHGGVITGIGGVAGHAHKHLPRGRLGYFGRARLIQTLSVVTGACMVVRKSIFHEVGGLDETNLKVAFNDVDLCLRVRGAGYRNAWTPYAELYHHESATRGFEDTPEKQLRFRDEVLYMQKRWGDQLTNDPAYSPNLTLDREDFSYAWPPRIVS